MLGLILSTIFPKYSFSQEDKVFPILTNYSRWSIVVGPIMYNKAKLTSQFGDYSFDNKIMTGYNFGLLYDFYPDRKWTIQSGLLLTKEPVYSLQFRIYKNDLYSSYPNDLVDDKKYFSIYSFSIPFYLRYNIQTSRKSFLSFNTGLLAKYLPYGGAELIVAISNEEIAETREIFGLNVESPENAFQGSFVVGAGFSYALQKILIKANIYYTVNFQNSISGEYQFVNLLNSADSRGYYDLSGNHLGLMMSIGVKKWKRNRNSN